MFRLWSKLLCRWLASATRTWASNISRFDERWWSIMMDVEDHHRHDFAADHPRNNSHDHSNPLKMPMASVIINCWQCTMCWKWSRNTQYTLLLSMLYWAIHYDSVQTCEHMSLKREAWEAVLPRHSGVLPGTFLKNHSIIHWLYKYSVLR